MYALDASLNDVLLFLVCVVAVVFVPGVGVLRLLKLRTPSVVVSLGVGGPLGLVLLCALGFVTARWSYAIAPAVLFCVGLVGLLRGGSASTRRTTATDGLVFATIAIGLVGLSPWWAIRGPEQDGLIPIYPYVDQYLHTGTVIEMLRGFPPAQMPHLAGEPFWQYHLFTDLFTTTVEALTDVPLLHQQGAYLPAFGIALVLLALAALAFTLTFSAEHEGESRSANQDNKAYLASSAYAALAVALYLSPRLADPGSVESMQVNVPSTLSVPVATAAVLLMVRLLRRRAAKGPALVELIVTGALSAAVFSLKAQHFLMLTPALGVLGLLLIRRGLLKEVLAGAVAGTVVVAAPALHHFTHPSPRPLAWKPGAFADWLAHHEFGPWAVDVFGSTGALVGSVILVTLWTVLGTGPLPWALAALATPALRRQLRGKEAAAVAGTFAVATLVVCYGPVEAGSRQFEAWNVGAFTRSLVTVLVVAAAMVGVQQLVARLDDRVTQASLRRAAPLLPVAFVVVVTVGRLASGPLYPPVGFPVPWLKATRAIALNAPDDAVVASVDSLHAGPYLSTFAGRRVVVERAVQFLAHYREVAERVGDLELMWSDPDPRHVQWLLDKYRVTHVLEHTAAPMALPVDQRSGWKLRLDAEVRVWEREPGPRRGVPAGLQPRRVEATKRHRAVIRLHQGVPLETILRDAHTDRATLERWNQQALAPMGPRALAPFAAPVPAATKDDLPAELRAGTDGAAPTTTPGAAEPP